ncbi:hypothetical protein KI387_008320, partial [Taxus chinensis]
SGTYGIEENEEMDMHLSLQVSPSGLNREGEKNHLGTTLTISDAADVLMVGEVVAHDKLHDVCDDAVFHQMKVPS